MKGLVTEEVRLKILQGQTNRVEKFTTRTIPAILRNNIFTVFNAVLTLSFSALFFIGAKIDALFLIGATLCNTLLGIIEELRAKWALDAIALIHQRTALVIRNDQEERIDAQQIVQGDLICIQPGDPILADGILATMTPLFVDESSITGEQDPVEKHQGDPLYSGCFCISGSGKYKTTAVGISARIHQISAQAKTYKFSHTPLQKAINQLIQLFTAVMILFVFLLLLAHLTKQATITESILSIVTIIKSLVPEGLVLICTLALALGAIRAAKRHVLVQKINAIESMSHLTILCLDKTGTLGTNQLEFDSLHVFTQAQKQVEYWLQQYVGASSDHNQTLVAIAKRFPAIPSIPIEELPFSSSKKYSGLTLQTTDDQFSLWLGMPEALNAHLTPSQELCLKQLRTQGCRVLGFGYSPFSVQKKKELTLIAFIALRDILRPGVKEALHFYESRGVQLKILSGDHTETVAAIAKETGMPLKGSTLSGSFLTSASPEEFNILVKEGQCFGELLPEQKKKIIASLQAQGEFVGMVGDGVNDLFALKQADIGIAMHAGVAAAQDIADIILLNDKFSHLPDLSQEGDRIIYNIKRISKLFLIKNIYCLFFILFTGFVGLAFPLSPRFITWIDLLTIGIPTTLLTLISPRIDKQITHHFMIDVLRYASFSGILIAFFSLLVDFYFSVIEHANPHYSKTASLCVIVFMNLYILFHLSVSELPKNQKHFFRILVLSIIAGSLSFLFIGLYWPPLSILLGLVPLHASAWSPIMLISILGIVTFCCFFKKICAAKEIRRME